MQQQHRTVDRRTLLKAGGLLAGAFALAGCSSGGDGYAQPKGDVPKQYADRVRVVLWSPFPANMQKPINKMVSDFNESQSDIYAESQYFKDHAEVQAQLQRGLQAKTIPDLAVIDAVSWSQFLFSGVLEPMDEYLDKFGVERSDYADAFLKEGLRNGKLWWLSFSRTCATFYYNKDAFAQAGLPDRAPQTWDELQEWGPELSKLTFQGKHPKVHTKIEDLVNWTYQGVAWAWGGAISKGLDVTVADKEAVAGAQWQRDFITKGMAEQSNNAAVDFYNQQAMTMISSGGAMNSIAEQSKFELGVGTVPKQVAQGTPTGGAGISILAGAPKERKEAAFQVLKYLTAPEQSAYFSTSTGYLPVSKGAVDTALMKKYIDQNPSYQALIDELKVARQCDDVLVQVPGAYAEVLSSIQKVYQGGGEAASILGELRDSLNQLVDKVKPSIDKWQQGA